MRVSAMMFAVVAALSYSKTADACSCFPAPDYGFLIQESRELPRNATGLVWIGSTAPEAEHFEVVQLVDGSERQVPFVLTQLPLSRWVMHAFLVKLTRPTRPGQTYRFRTTLFVDLSSGDARAQEREVVVSEQALKLEAISVPYQLTPNSKEIITLATAVACSHEFEATTVRGQVLLPPPVVPFQEHLLFTTILDGRTDWTPAESTCSLQIPGRSWMGPGKEMFFRVCPRDERLSGEHTAAQEVFFPAGGQSVTTSTQRFQIPCPPD